MAGIWIFAESLEQTKELLSIGSTLASKLGTMTSVFLQGNTGVADDYIACGADEVLVLTALAEDQPLDAYIPVIAAEAQTADPDIFLIAATVRGKDIAARLAARLKTGLCSECIGLKADENDRTIEMERFAYGGAAIQTVVCSTRPVMVTIIPRTFEAAARQSDRKGTIRELPAAPPSASTVLERKPKETEAKDISESRIVVCAGRGIEKKEDLSLVQELAAALGGEIGCTRPISEESHWLPEDLCIGISGISVKPALYIGLGVSGQVQHITGIRDAKVICAVNKDENAPIFGASDYGIVGDLYDVAPKLSDAVKNMKG
ncbi:MAG: electron transfer flavoprotein subunit alpha/FixB family protein [Deltaproteobacteria bacterium]|nr:electron transfer flavoprotein subunit alpha/FixB family protein [Deltaproteobacteria bacterium]MBN2688947.1 electron transfer flavoprotein subunit alpha/FixB family protein [Deltaproteobacteria bacterium]